MVQRVIWGVLGGGLLFGLVWAGGLWYALALGLLVTLATLEYTELLKCQKFRPQTRLILFFNLFLMALIYVILDFGGLTPWESIYQSERILLLMLVTAFLAISFRELLRGIPHHGLINAAVNLFGTVYIGFMFAYILLLRYIPGQKGFYVFFTILVTWANDSVAYFVGTNIGRHKLCPGISPNKSIEGSVGGLAGGLVMAIGLGALYHHPLWPMALLGFLVVIAGQCGDLVESVIKRNAGVKDSGAFLPGHGGVLDRFDSLLMAAPVVFYAVTYILPLK